MTPATSLAQLPPGVLVLLGVLAAAQLALEIYALVDLYRRPRAQVVGGNKWVWVAVIVLVNYIGAVLYLALARQPAPAVEPGPLGREPERIGDIVDELYGPRDSDRP